MTPAEIVIQRFGGVRPLARILEKDPSTIHRWKSYDKGGLCGRVPSAMQSDLLRLARERGVVLSPDDLVMGDDGRAVSCAVVGGNPEKAPTGPAVSPTPAQESSSVPENAASGKGQ